jgi:hypothetical protein
MDLMILTDDPAEAAKAVIDAYEAPGASLRKRAGLATTST